MPWVTVYQFGITLSTAFDTPIIEAMHLKALVLKSLSSGLSQRTLADQIGVSHGTINNIVAGHPPTKLNTLTKFQRYYQLSMEQLRGDPLDAASTQQIMPPPASRLHMLIAQLDEEQRKTLERCAEAFLFSTPDVRQHLIGQLKIVERLVEYEKDKPGKKKINRKA